MNIPTDKEIISEARALLPSPWQVQQDQCRIFMQYPFFLQIPARVVLFSAVELVFKKDRGVDDSLSWSPVCMKVAESAPCFTGNIDAPGQEVVINEVNIAMAV